MQKCLIFLTMLFSVSVWAGLDWNPYVMTHERFVHLSSEDKEQVIIKTMEMIVEMEGKYRKTVVQNEPNQELYENYMVLVKKLQNLLISEAYATDVSDNFIKRAQQFSSLLTLLKDDACIYAGYVSKLVAGRCTNPALIPKGKPGSKDAKIKAAYLSATNEKANKSGKCGSTSKISCNPVVFGYKQSASGVPFCVNTSPDEAHNAAYECMKVALADNAGDALTDSKEKRLGYLKAALSDSTAKAPFDKAHGFIFKTCMCGDTGLNPAYTKYMRPHRTCFGMLNTLRAIDSKECSALNSQTAMQAFGDQWSNYYGATSFEKQNATREVGFDTVYKDILSKPEMIRLCSANPDDGIEEETEGNECVAPCKKEKDKDGKEVTYCTVSSITSKKKVDGKMVTTVVKEFKEVKLLLEAGKTSLTYESKDGKSYVCDNLAADADEEPEAKLGCELTPDKDKKSVSLKWINLKDGQKPPTSVVWSGDGEVDKSDPNLFKAKEGKGKITITATFKPDDAPAPATGAPAAATATATTTDKEKDKTKTEGDKKDDKTAPPADPNSCSTTLGDDEGNGEENFDITTSSEAGSTNITVNVKAVVTVAKGEMPADYVIVWVRQGYKGPKTEEKKPETSTRQGDSDAPVVTTSSPTTTPDGPAVVKTGTPGSKESDIEETKIQEEYKTCAELRDGAGKKVKDSCETIPAIVAPRPNNGGAVNRPPAFVNPSYNTRTMGVQ